MNMRRIIAASALALAAIIAAGCSSGGSKSSAQDRIHASAASKNDAQPNAADVARLSAQVCGLYDTAAVNAFFKSKSQESYSDTTKCIRKAGDNQMTVSLWRDQNRDMYTKYVAARSDAQTVAGVGDGADYSADRQALQFLKGDVVVTVSVTGNNLNSNALQSFLVSQAKYAASKV
jgi:hypothetical protein